MARSVALLRGINVGGNSVIRMADLRACFERGGFADVETYIQSGNVLFTAIGPPATLIARIEAMLADDFGHPIPVVLRSRAQLSAVVDRAPEGFGDRPDEFRSDVIYLRPGITPAKALAAVATKDGVDRAWVGPGVLYFERLTARASQSRLSKIVSSPIYPHVTIRTWRTTVEVLRRL
jgi:uncharacterized protein (DUF1697 family)